MIYIIESSQAESNLLSTKQTEFELNPNQFSSRRAQKFKYSAQPLCSLIAAVIMPNKVNVEGKEYEIHQTWIPHILC